jgi:hypothetical protein
LATIALLCGAWLALAAWAVIGGVRRGREGRAGAERAQKLDALLGAGPAVPLLVHDDGSRKAASGWPASSACPTCQARLAGVRTLSAGLAEADLNRLGAAVRESAAGARADLASLCAPQGSPGCFGSKAGLRPRPTRAVHPALVYGRQPRPRSAAPRSAAKRPG